MANITKIKLSGTSYDIQDSNAARSITLTQAEYDALQNKDPNVFYIISDSTLNYVTSAETESAITQAVTTVNNALTAHTANTTVHVTAQDKTNWNAKSDFSGNYNDLTNKPTIPTVPTNVSDFTNDAGYITSDDISGKTNQSDFTAHTANTTAHVTQSEKNTWNAKSDFSGSYNDLSNKPTIPTSASQLTNDVGYITSSALDGYATTGDVQTATNDMATKTWVGQQGYLTEHQDISGKQDVSGMTAYTKTSAFTAHTANTTVHVTAADKTAWNNKSDFSGSYNDLTNKLSAGTNISIVDNVISAEGGGKAVSGGTNISVTTGETADTINCTLPITGDTNANAPKIKIGSDYSLLTSNSSVSQQNTNKARSNILFGNGNTVSSNDGYGGGISYNFLLGEQNSVEAVGIYKPISAYNMLCGVRNATQSSYGFVLGNYNTLSKGHQFAVGDYHTPKNDYETNFGKYSNSVSASTTFGNSGNTLFSVGNGTSTANTHNAFEIRQNGDIYLTLDGQDVKLQDQLGSGGSSYTAGDGIDITNDVISVTGKVDTSAFTAHTADTTIHVTSAEKATWNAKSDFSGSYNDLTNKPTIPTSASQLTNDTGYITSSALDSYATTATTSALNNTLTAHTADTTIHVTSADKSSWNGAATNASNAVTALGGLSLVKLTQTEYDALATKDSNTLYVING